MKKTMLPRFTSMASDCHNCNIRELWSNAIANQFILHVTRFLHCRVLNSNTGIFYCPKAMLDRHRGKNLPRTRLYNS